jgi:[ribosomal protein S18]-alanine N-acetyltransferase
MGGQGKERFCYHLILLNMDVQPSSPLCLAIKPAESSHLDQILDIEQAVFSAPWTRSMFDAEVVGNPFSRLFVATPIDDRGQPEGIVGYLCYWIVFEELRLLNLAVSPPWQRQGVARRFVQFALHEAQSQGVERALLEVRASNLAAQSLYDGFGFREYGSRAAYYTNPGEDAILMRLEPLEFNDVL